MRNILNASIKTKLVTIGAHFFDLQTYLYNNAIFLALATESIVLRPHFQQAGAEHREIPFLLPTSTVRLLCNSFKLVALGRYPGSSVVAVPRIPAERADTSGERSRGNALL